MRVRKLIAEAVKAEVDAAISEAARGKAKGQEFDKALAEIYRLKAETDKLRKESANLPPSFTIWIPVFSALVAVVGVYMTARNGIRQALENRVGTLDEKLYDQRTAAYKDFLKAMEPLGTQVKNAPLTPIACQAVASNLRRIYYAGGGLVLTDDSRLWWSCLVALLAKAGALSGGRLKVPMDSAAYADECSDYRLEHHRKLLGLDSSDARIVCHTHVFGKVSDVGDPKPLKTERIKDYVFLHFAASRFRSALAHDFQSRRLIADLKPLRANP